MTRLSPYRAVALCFLLAGCVADSAPVAPDEAPSAKASESNFEVWLVDQSNSPGLAWGGAVYIWDGSDVMGASASRARPAAVIDLGQAADAMCFAATGAHVVRPHMIFFNAAQSHAIISFVASGHVLFIDADTRQPVRCVRTSPGAGGARQAHAAYPSLDDAFVLVANQNGKLLERIDTHYATNSFVLNPAATINLATCVTPNGVPCELAGVRPDNAPICGIIDDASRLGFVTLRGGGLFVVNPRVTPMAIVGEYDRATVHPNGCGGEQAANSMFINSGGGTPANLTEFDVYRFPLAGYSPSNPPNTPAPLVVFSDDVGERDSHGMVVTKHDRYLWVLDRVGNIAEVFDLRTNRRVNTVSFATNLSADPAPDLADISPSGNRVFVSLRGPTPLTGDPHVSTGTTPGLGVVQVTQGGKNGSIKSIVRISNKGADGIERADPHGIRVRHK